MSNGLASVFVSPRVAKGLRGIGTLLLLGGAMGGCAPPPSGAPSSIVPAMEAIGGKAPAAAIEALARREERPLLVLFRSESAVDMDETEVGRRERAETWRARKVGALSVTNPHAVRVTRMWEELPLTLVQSDSLDDVTALAMQDDVAALFDVEELEASDTASFALINQPVAAAAGKQGAGTAVAVIDTGCDYTRPAFGSCTSPGVPASCRVAYAQDFAPDDRSLDDNGHGTNVSGIVAGVAPAARVLALDVFAGGTASSVTVIDAINWVIKTKATYNTASINLSLGGGSATAPCTLDPIGAAIASARQAGIVSAVAAGNNGWINALSSPACSPSAVSVGAVYDANLGGIGYGTCMDATTAADKVACFSNSASFLTVLAPGAIIDAAGYQMAGTSQAAPHVAGALAVLRAAFPNDTVDQAVARLTSTGRAVIDPRNGISKPRIDLGAAVGPPPDTTPPTGTVKINAGATATKTIAVTLSISGTDASGVTSMCVSNSTTCTAYSAFATSVAWTLTSGDGTKTVTVFLRDKVGNTTSLAGSPTASIVLDTTAPSDGALTATPGTGQVALSWSAASDKGTSVASYRVTGQASTVPASGCGGTTLYAGPARTFTQSGLTKGKVYGYRVCAVDALGNVSVGATATATVR